MKKNFIVNLDSLTDLSNFVTELTTKISSDVDGIYQRQVVDAKSYLGLVSISIHPVNIVINTDDEDEIALFNEICKKYKTIEED